MGRRPLRHREPAFADLEALRPSSLSTRHSPTPPSRRASTGCVISARADRRRLLRRAKRGLGNGQKRTAVDTQVYKFLEIERISRRRLRAGAPNQVHSAPRSGTCRRNHTVVERGGDPPPRRTGCSGRHAPPHPRRRVHTMQLAARRSIQHELAPNNLFGDSVLPTKHRCFTGSSGCCPRPRASSRGRRASTSRCTARRRTSRARGRQPHRHLPGRHVLRYSFQLIFGGDGGPNRKGHHFAHYNKGTAPPISRKRFRAVRTAEMGNAIITLDHMSAGMHRLTRKENPFGRWRDTRTFDHS